MYNFPYLTQQPYLCIWKLRTNKVYYKERVGANDSRLPRQQVIKACYGCKRFRATAFASPPPGNLPRDRTEGGTAFQVVGVDFAGLLKYREKGRREAKAYIVLYACSLTRGLYLELLPNLETTEFLSSLKRLIARRERPKKIYSDNGQTFVWATKWLKTVMKDERPRFPGTPEHSMAVQLKSSALVGGQFERTCKGSPLQMHREWSPNMGGATRSTVRCRGRTQQ